MLAPSRPVTYRYEAIDGRGAVLRGTLQAADAADAAEMLRTRGLLPVRLTPRFLPGWRRSPSREEVAAALRVLSSLLDATGSSTHALIAFDALAPRAWRPALVRVRERMHGGAPLGAVLAAELRLSEPLATTIRSADTAGELAQGSRRAAALAWHPR